MKVHLLVLLPALLAACVGDDRPPPTSANHPASPRAAEARFDPGPNPLAPSSAAAPAPVAEPHGGHHHGSMADGGAH